MINPVASNVEGGLVLDGRPSRAERTASRDSADENLTADIRSDRFDWFSLVAGAMATFALFTLFLLTRDVMGERLWNETDVPPLARQAVDSGWVPNDWYLNQGASYRFLFEQIAGRLVRAFGFVGAAMIGRVACYALAAISLSWIARAIKLRWEMLAIAVAALLIILPSPNTLAGEWFVGGFEAKSISWGLMLLAIAASLHRRHKLAAFVAGVGTSFHVLVGGWALLAMMAWWLLDSDLRRRQSSQRWKALIVRATLALVGAIAAIPPVWHQLTDPRVVFEIKPSFIYVFLRLPHHLNPNSWYLGSWVQLCALCFLVAMSVFLLRRRNVLDVAPRHGPSDFNESPTMRFARLVAIGLVPFAIGLSATFWDRDGLLLRYYPFRFAGVLLPLGASLLTALVLQRYWFDSDSRRQKMLAIVRLIALFGVFFLGVFKFQAGFDHLGTPTAPAGDTSHSNAWIDMCAVVGRLTPRGSTIIAPPVGGADFTWRSGRATVANFKLLPQKSARIAEWYQRMRDLSGGLDLKSFVTTTSRGGHCSDPLAIGYHSLSTDAVVDLMVRYRAPYFITTVEHRLHLPVLYRNKKYTLYGAKPPSSKPATSVSKGQT